MTIPAGVLSILALLSAAATIGADVRKKFGLVYIFKPLTMVLIVALAAIGRQTGTPRYKYCVLAGLVFSLGGDVFMMLRRKRFLEGLACFFTAHLFFIAAFLSHRPGSVNVGLLLPFGTYLGFMTGILWTRLGRMKVPVVLYMLVLTAMAVLAAERYHLGLGGGAVYALLGSILFVVSDSLLAANRFIREFRPAQILILGSYFAAQWLIALSV